MIHNKTINCLKCLLKGIERPAIRQMRGTGEPVCAIHALEGLPSDFANRNVGRNDKCHCGSGKKFKKCHGSPQALAETNTIKIEFAKPE